MDAEKKTMLLELCVTRRQGREEKKKERKNQNHRKKLGSVKLVGFFLDFPILFQEKKCFARFFDSK